MSAAETGTMRGMESAGEVSVSGFETEGEGPEGKEKKN
jgi:hypothetical protein